MLSRKQIVDCARSFLGTPFGHQGRVKGVALDCVGLPLMISQELGIVDTRGQQLNGALYSSYSEQPLGNYVYDMCKKHLIYKPLSQMKPGDVIVLRVITAPCHVAVVGDGYPFPSMIHAYNGGPEKCVEHLIDAKWRERIAGCFSFPGVEGGVPSQG